VQPLIPVGVFYVNLRGQYEGGNTRDEALADADAAGVDNVLQMKLVGARKAKIAGQEPLLSRSRYFHGNAPEKWLGDVPHYAKVNYAAVYPHTDVVFYGRQGELEYDVVLGPGADPSGVVLEFTGARQLRVDDQGDLRLLDPTLELTLGSEVHVLPAAAEELHARLAVLPALEPMDVAVKTEAEEYRVVGDGGEGEAIASG